MDPKLSAAALPPPLDLSHHFSTVTKNRAPNSMKGFYKFFQIPGIGNLAGGLPNESFFPFDTLEAQVAKPERWAPTPNGPIRDLTANLATAAISDLGPASHITVPKVAPVSDPTKKIDLSTALQYGTAEGYAPLRSFLRQFTRDHLHPVAPYLGGPEITLTCGSTDAFSKVVELLVDPWFPATGDVRDRPGMLCEEIIYNVPLTNAGPKGVQAVPVKIDAVGMLASGPGGLEDVLENWDSSKGRRPHFMYTVTMGQNPTGSLLSLDRRRELYSVCCKYDIIIVEDEPYWNLQFPSVPAMEARSRGWEAPQSMAAYKPVKSSGYDYLDSLTPSYVSLDTEGRVIRLDTFSKTIAPGCRLGWITAQPALIERLERIAECSTQAPSGFVQAMVAELIMGPQTEAAQTFRTLSAKDKLSFSGWNMDGWVRWLEGLRGAYERRMTKMCTVLDDNSYLLKQSTPVRDGDQDWGVITKTQVLSFHWPRAGMFVWVQVHLESHPLWQTKGKAVAVFDGPALAAGLTIFCSHKPHLVMPGPGALFAATPTIRAEKAWAYLRLCFGAVPDEDIAPCSWRFANAVQKFWRIKKADEMEAYISEATWTKNMQDQEGLNNLGFPMGC